MLFYSSTGAICYHPRVQFYHHEVFSSHLDGYCSFWVPIHMLLCSIERHDRPNYYHVPEGSEEDL
jgi:hypothetical protein